MDDGWFYADEGKSIGPVTYDALLAALRNMLDPGKVKVWHAGFSDWRDAKDVPQLSDQLLRPPPLVAAKLERTPTRSSEVEPSEQDAAMKLPKNTRRRVVSLVALVAVVVLGSIFSSVIFDRPLEGIAYLAGEFVVYAGALYLLSLPWRRSTYRAAVVMLLAALGVGLSNGQKLLDSFAVEDVKTALQQARTPEQIGKALEQNPSNPLLQLITKATNAALETDRLADQISNEIEPPSLTKEVDFAHAGRADLEAYRRDLKAAEANAIAAAPRYVALLDEERKKIETFAQSLRVDESTTRGLLSGVDKRHARSKDFTLRMLAARAELYRTLGSSAAILIEQFGKYKVDANGRFLFSSQSIADRYNDASRQVSAATNRLAELEKERKKLIQFQQEGWESFVSGK